MAVSGMCPAVPEENSRKIAGKNVLHREVLKIIGS